MQTSPINKSSLHALRRRLAVYERVLPSLDLKRRQLAAQLVAARARLVALHDEERAMLTRTGNALPALADPDLRLDELFAVENVDSVMRTTLGIQYPVAGEVRLAVRAYAMLGTPSWTECLQRELVAAVTRRIGIAATVAECMALEQGMRRTQQRQNLFEKRLIPLARTEVRRIELALDDMARAAVVRAKIALRRNERTRTAGR